MGQRQRGGAAPVAAGLGVVDIIAVDIKPHAHRLVDIVGDIYYVEVVLIRHGILADILHMEGMRQVIGAVVRTVYAVKVGRQVGHGYVCDICGRQGPCARAIDKKGALW